MTSVPTIQEDKITDDQPDEQPMKKSSSKNHLTDKDSDVTPSDRDDSSNISGSDLEMDHKYNGEESDSDEKDDGGIDMDDIDNAIDDVDDGNHDKDGKTELSKETLMLYGKRFKVVNEIVSSEYVYVRDLKLLNDIFVTPLKNDLSILTVTEMNGIYSMLEVIYSINQDIYKSLKQHFNSAQQKGKVNIESVGNMLLGEIFLQKADFLKMYATYCADYNNRLEKHVALRKKKS